MKKIVLLICIALVLVFTGCGHGDDFEGPYIKDGFWYVNGENANVKAEGTDGTNGLNGKTPYIENGYWYVDGVNTNVPAAGENGKSAYNLYCEKYQFQGTEEEWLIALVNGDLATKEYCTVTFNPENGDEPFTQVVEKGKHIECPEVSTVYGYRVSGWFFEDVSGYEKWLFQAFTVNSDITLTAKWDYFTYELPIINIDTNGEAINSKEDYTDMTFNIKNCSDELEDVTGGIRLRGNSTLGFDKKPYRIKFDKKQSLFGLEKAKSWVLLAEYLDPSGMHNSTAFNIGLGMPGLEFTPSPHKVNVYLNGEFLGLYTLCEQVQENEGRMNIEMEEITTDMIDLKDYNFFISMDSGVISDPTAVLDETYFYLEEHNMYFELKYPEKEDFPSDEQFESFFSQLKTYTNDIVNAFKTRDYDVIEENININSLIDYLIVDQFMGEMDHYWKSFNMYYVAFSDNTDISGKLNFGPIWDYDWALHTPWTGKPNQSFELSDQIAFSNIFFKIMANTPRYRAIICERYTLYARDAVDNAIKEIKNQAISMKDSINENHALWYSSYDENLSVDNVEFLIAFLENRKVVLDEIWFIEL